MVNPNIPAEEALNDNKSFAVLWGVLNALCSHDERFNALINSIALNKKNPTGKIAVGTAPFVKPIDGTEVTNPQPDSTDQTTTDGGQEVKPAVDTANTDTSGETETNTPTDTTETTGETDPAVDAAVAAAEQKKEIEQKITEQLSLLKDYDTHIYARMVDKVGSRLYWQRWARDIGPLAAQLIARITELVNMPGPIQDAFAVFVEGLRDAINDSISTADAITMLGQHLITRPVFEAIFEQYAFDENNAVTRAMQHMVRILDENGLQKDTAELEKFYQTIRNTLGNVTTLSGKQDVIRNLYDNFFKGAFPKAVEQLGIVYTPVECVDFILHSVNGILQREFHLTLSDAGVHILDPFTGTGTFITRLLQSRLIRQEDLERKYKHEIHCNEIVLLAYYVADVNIESVYNDVMETKDYLEFDGICLTDTFAIEEHLERHEKATAQMLPGMVQQIFAENSAQIVAQSKAPIRVIIGNPPYSVGQKSANDNAQNLKYPWLDKRIEETYVAAVKTTNKNSLYDSYIRAFRWASDRLCRTEGGGVIGFITNGGWLDGNAAAGFRKCLEDEFSSIYVVHLRGDARTSGELRRKEGDGVFGLGSRAPVVITFLVYNPTHTGKASIQFYDIGDYLTRQKKLDLLTKYRSIFSPKIQWRDIQPDEHGDWVKQRSDLFTSLLAIGDKKDKEAKEKFFEDVYSRGLATGRDAWCYNFSTDCLAGNIQKSIAYYNEQCDAVKEGRDISYNPACFSWTRATENSARKDQKFAFGRAYIRKAQYRPFCTMNLYFSRNLNEMVYQIPHIFPTTAQKNTVICLHSPGGKKDFSCLMVDTLPDLEIVEKSQCFPLYY